MSNDDAVSSMGVRKPRRCGAPALTVLLAGLLGFEIGSFQFSRPYLSFFSTSPKPSLQERSPHLPNGSQASQPAGQGPRGAQASGEQTRSWAAPGWSVSGAHKKEGAGLLFFAYGSIRTLDHFVKEAATAAQSFRRHNPKIAIAIVSNNASVSKVFNIHIKPRKDLLFAGENLQHRLDNIPRQWLTRLYYMAHSPFRLTWALDSNVISCSPGAAQRLLDTALESQLWGYHIAHASQNLLSNIMYPHNFNIIFMWNPITSDLLREWFLTAISEGIASDDQKSLHIAELRMRARLIAAGRELSVGRMAPEFSAAFYDVMGRGNATHPPQKRLDKIRITPVLKGAVHLLHATNLSLCDTFNAQSGVRQLLMRPIGKGRKRILNYTTLTDAASCSARLADDNRYCLIKPLQSGDAVLPKLAQQDYILPTQLEDLHAYAHSRRCGAACEGQLVEESKEYNAVHTVTKPKTPAPRQPSSHEHYTSCAELSGRRLQYLDRLEPRCPEGKVIQNFGITDSGCRSGHLRAGLRCMSSPALKLDSGATGSYPTLRKETECSLVRGEPLRELRSHKLECDAGYALVAWQLTDAGCSWRRNMRFQYDCGFVSDPSYLRDGVGVVTRSTNCSRAVHAPVASLASHLVSCPPTHALSSLHFTGRQCDGSERTMSVFGNLANKLFFGSDEMHYVYQCSPVSDAPIEALATR